MATGFLTRKLFKDPQSERQILLDVRRLLPDLELLDLLGLLVQLEVVEDDGDEERHHDEGDEQVVQDEVDGDHGGQVWVHLKQKKGGIKGEIN